MTKVSNQDKLSVLTELMMLDKLSTVKIGFLTVMRVDENTFTITEIDEDDYQLSLPKDHVNETNVNSDT
jgi:hypothetical protein